jgi:hypothetical protein
MNTEEKLRAVISKWRDTADVWEHHSNGGLAPLKRFGYDIPPEKGRGQIRNWVSWLRGCANEVAAVLDGSQQPPGDSAGRGVGQKEPR